MNENYLPTDSSVLNDPKRLEAIANLGLFSEEVRKSLDGITERAAVRFNLPVSLVTAVLHDTQFFVSSYGLEAGWLADARGTPIEWSFCRFAVEERREFVVGVPGAEERVRGNPLVTEGLIGCYAGVPLISTSGNALGTLCVIGPKVRVFAEDEIQELKRLGEMAVREIERLAQLGN
ncbi:GAF domain-containing protein [Pelagicoccus enzymogenes]|uniref:GAF domain-containing protein n=1 Tax=Pelagicoccus enzymogenes TaxID=2773457 RepID=UPI00280C8EA5|nr:GAF domain-containing protein [Pelagicoccus enzymogenes]MDQ8200251.1 GAF domain-containing protein [Pelagicoccus enzymogenes]